MKLDRLRELRRLHRIRAERAAAVPIERRCPDPADRAALTDPAILAAHLDSNYQIRAHLRVIGAEMAALNRGEFRRLMINLPPQCGKTRTTVEWGVFWWLCLHPGHRVVIGSYGDDLAVRRGEAIRRLVSRHGTRFGLRLEYGSSAKKDWTLTTGGGVRSVGVGSSITGFDADALWVDDPTKSRHEADSPVYRRSVADWYSADLLTRRAPGAPIVLVQTPWHPDDLRAQVLAQEGRVEEGGRWRAVVMPALCTDPERDPLGRAVGDPLPHPKVPEGDRVALLAHWMEARATATARDWAALYQCDPAPPEGTLLRWEVLRERRCFQSGSPSGPCAPAATVAVAVDPSGGGRDTAGIVAGYLGLDGRLYLTHDRSGAMASEKWARRACELAAEVGADRFVVEVNFGADMATLAIRTAWEALRRENPGRFGSLIPRIVAVRARRGKLLRAEPIAQQWVEDRIRTAAYLPELEQEWVSWVPGPESPGRIDASVHLAYDLLPVPASGSSSASGAAVLAGANLLPWGR